MCTKLTTMHSKIIQIYYITGETKDWNSPDFKHFLCFKIEVSLVENQDEFSFCANCILYTNRAYLK